MSPRHEGFQTNCLHGGDEHNRSGHLSPPVTLSTAFEFPSTDEGARRAADIRADDFYGRWGSANAREFESIVAALEHAEDAVCASSGLAIVSMITHAFLSPGDHFVGVHQCYSETAILLQSLAEQMSLDATFVDAHELDELTSALRPDTSLVFIETPANPTITVVDIAEVADLVHRRTRGVLVVDSTFATPFNQQPLALGADVVMHSATKYLGGHHDVIAGVAAGARELLDKVREKFSYHGPHLDPFAAWLLCRGLRTLGLRMARHNSNALHMATFLESHPKVERVSYPMLSSHKQHDVAARQMTGGGGMVCFETAGGFDGAMRVVSNTKLVKLAVSLGGVASTITHPRSMTHNLLSREELDRAGITDSMIRFSVGIEEPEDIQRDIEQALEHV